MKLLNLNTPIYSKEYFHHVKGEEIFSAVSQFILIRKIIIQVFLFSVVDKTIVF